MANAFPQNPSAAELIRRHAEAIRKIPDLSVSKAEAGCFAGQYLQRAIELGAFSGGPRDPWLPRLRERFSYKKDAQADPHLSAFAEVVGLIRTELGMARTPPDVTSRASFAQVAAVLESEALRLERSPSEPESTGMISVIPSEVVAIAFLNLVHGLHELRREWVKGDVEQVRLLKTGCDPATSGYAEIMRTQVRANVRLLYERLKSGADFVPLILSHCDPSLRDEILRVLRLLEPDATLDDRYGKESARWRQTWPAMGLDADFDALIPKLRAAADQLTLEGDPVMLAREWLEGYEFRLGQADRARHLSGSTRMDYLKALRWADDPKADRRHEALTRVLEQLKAMTTPPYSPDVLVAEYDALLRTSVESRLAQHFPDRLRAWLDRAASFLSSVPSESPPVTAVDRRPAGWFHTATEGALYPDLLRMATRDLRLTQSKKRGGRWQHSIEEVSQLYSQYRALLQKAKETETTVRKPKN